VTFFREPVAKYVSGRLYSNRHRNWNFDEAVAEIRRGIVRSAGEAAAADGHMNGTVLPTERRKIGYYNGYEKYLTTPAQKAQMRAEAGVKRNGGDSRHERVAELIEANLVRYNVLVGVVERMADSLSLLQSVLDADRELTDLFRTMVHREKEGSGSGRRNGTSSSSGGGPPGPLVENRSRLSTSAVIERLEADPGISQMLREVLKYEFRLYDFALRLHERQVEQMRRRYGDTYTFT